MANNIDLHPSRSPLDPKLYRQVLLENGIRAVLVSDTIALQSQGKPQECFDCGMENGSSSSEEDDSSSEQDDENSHNNNDSGLRDAAAAVVVNAGSLHESIDGLAHFLEHLLFMGSAKYPAENDYESFVAQHGGSDNAWTERESTSYHLSIPQEYLWPALDRLAQFFIHPLLSPSAVDRELHAIESEFQLNRQSDTTRWQQLLSATSQPGHPYAHFPWGNHWSLRDRFDQTPPLEALRDFFDRHYYGANLSVVVLGAYSLDELERRVQDCFGNVQAKPRSGGGPCVYDDPIDSWDRVYQSPLSKEVGLPFGDRQRLFRIVPTKEKHALSIVWQLPPCLHQYKSKPYDFCAHLMGHEAQGSLLAYFRQQSWATGCTVGLLDEGQTSCCSLFQALFTLTESGMEHWKDMVEATYQYIGLLRGLPTFPSWIFEELQQVNAMAYHYSDELAPEDFCECLADSLPAHYQLPPERLLDGHHLLFEWDETAVREWLDQLVPQNARIDLTSSSFGKPADYSIDEELSPMEVVISNLRVLPETGSFDREVAGQPMTERMFGTFFWAYELPDTWVEEWSSLAASPTPTVPIALPPQNPFVPTKFELKELPGDDSRHPLVDASLKVCITVGKKKQWVPATVMRYSKKKKALQLVYEDGEEKWHVTDGEEAALTPEVLVPGFEGTMDKRAVRYRLVSVALRGQASPEDGDDAFPAIPPPSPASRLPKQISNTNSLKMWHLQDRMFHRPIADLRLQVNCAKGNASPMFRACAELLAELCSDSLLERSYLASICELGSCVEATDVGFFLRFHGFDDKLFTIFEESFKVLLSFRTTGELPKCTSQARFDDCLEVLRRRHRNDNMSSERLASNLRLQAVRTNRWSPRMKLEALEAIDVSSFLSNVNSLLENFCVEAFYHGNVDVSDATAVKDSILQMIGDSRLARKQYPNQSIYRIPTGIHSLCVPSRNDQDMNTAVEVYYQVGKDSVEDRAMIDLLVTLMEEPIYDQLRTKEQLGYDVSCDVRWTYGIMGFLFKVVTNVKSASHVQSRIENFLSGFRETLASMPEDSFRENLVGLVSEKLDMFNSLDEATDSYWEEIRDGRFDWEAWRSEAIFLCGVSRQDALKAYDRWLAPGDPQQRILVVSAVGYSDNESSDGRPSTDDNLDAFFDSQIAMYHKTCKDQRWGRVNSKLF